MSRYIIKGGNALNGTVTVSGAKNAVLPILSAALLCNDGKVTLHNCPDITDVWNTIEILRVFGCEVSFRDGQITVDSTNAEFCSVPCELASRLRSACLFMGASLSRFGRADECLPGGCELGPRPIDMHLRSFMKMGVSVCDTVTGIVCEGAPHGTDIFLRYPSVGATENVILCAALAKGTTTVTNAAREPEIADLCRFINRMGGKISGAGSSTVIIEGVEKLHSADYNIMGDRIEAATFLACALATDGEINVCGIDPQVLTAVTDVLVGAGGSVCRKSDSISVRRGGKFILPPPIVETSPYPGFPTDAQSVVMAMLLKCLGRVQISEKVFSDRMRVTDEFKKMGADITVSDCTATIRGVEHIYGSNLYAGDLRSGAALVVAALSAKGESTVGNIHHINRGYHNFVQKLSALGGDIKVEKEQ